jgi:MSHA pilin protein MshB
MKKLEMKRKQQGFTIIELVVVILLLGILTATALPRFMDVTDEAHDAVVSGVIGGLSTGNALFRAQWYAENQPSVPSEFGGLAANRFGYPIGVIAAPLTGATITSVGTSANCVEIFEGLLQPGGRPSIKALTETANALPTVTTLTTAGLYDFVAYLDNSAGSVIRSSCKYFYTGQFNRIGSANVPTMTYNARTGELVLSKN